MHPHYRIEGYAIVSADGMLADSERHIPPELQIEADQAFFHGELDRAAVIVQGRHSYEGGPKAEGRKRLVMTRRVPALAAHPRHALGLNWNPQGASFEDALARLDVTSGLVAIIGGPEVYQHFLGVGYDAFHLTSAPQVRLPGGRPVFTEIDAQRTPEDVLADHGLHPGPAQMFDRERDVTLVSWLRRD